MLLSLFCCYWRQLWLHRVSERRTCAKCQTSNSVEETNVVSVRGVHPMGRGERSTVLYRNLRGGIKIRDQPIKTTFGEFIIRKIIKFLPPDVNFKAKMHPIRFLESVRSFVRPSARLCFRWSLRLMLLRLLHERYKHAGVSCRVESTRHDFFLCQCAWSG